MRDGHRITNIAVGFGYLVLKLEVGVVSRLRIGTEPDDVTAACLPNECCDAVAHGRNAGGLTVDGETTIRTYNEHHEMPLVDLRWRLLLLLRSRGQLMSESLVDIHRSSDKEEYQQHE